MFDLNVPLNLLKIYENFDIGELGDRVRNMVLFENEDFIIMLVIGPNRRSDYHLNSKDVFILNEIYYLLLFVCRNSFSK